MIDAAGVQRTDLAVGAGPVSRAEVRELRARAGGADAGLAHVELGRFSWRELEVARALRIPLAVTVHEPSLGVAAQPVRVGGRVAEALARRRVGSLLRRADLVLTLGTAAESRVRAEFGLERTASIPHVAFAGPRADAGADGPVRVLFAGFHGEGKGLDVLLDAFAAALPALPEGSRLVVAGAKFIPDGRDEVGELIAAAGVPVERTGYVHADAFAALFASCHVAVVPYTAVPGGASGILIRALGAGLATVVSDVPALRQEVEPGASGLVVPPGDQEALAAALRALADPALRARLGTAAADAVARRGAPEALAPVLRGLYERAGG